MLCYKNGSLTREGTNPTQYTFQLCHFIGPQSNNNFELDIRNRCAEKSWVVFNKLVEQTPPLNGLYT